MNLMECGRKGCANNACGRYSPVYGYICNECFSELVNLGIRADMAAFMASPKDPLHKKDGLNAARRYFGNFF